MVEIKYGDNYEASDLAGHSVDEARQQFKAELGIPDKARARLNGRNVKGELESEVTLCEDDKLSFAKSSVKGAYLAGALLLALAVTGGVFAYGWINSTVTLTAAAATQDFAAVSANTTTAVTWSPYGFYKGSITAGATGTPIFNVDTATAVYTGDLVVTVSLANADTLAKCYRVLALKLMMYDSGDNIVDINESTVGDDDDYVLLTLNNGEVNMFPGGAADNMTVRVKSGFYVSHIFKGANWTLPAQYEPELFCEVAQR